MRTFPLCVGIGLALMCGAFSIVVYNWNSQGDSTAPIVLPTRVPRPSLPSPVSMADITKASGIHFKHNNAAFGLHFYPESNGGGVAFIDYDNDGDQDIFFVNGRDWTSAEINAYKNGEGRVHQKLYGFVFPKPKPYRRTVGALYRNNGNATFTDVTVGSGLDIEMLGMGVAVGDYDNDGRSDIYVTGYGRNYLFHNESSSAPKFREVAEKAGVRDGGFGASAAWLDYDRDGKLDLFTCRYIDWNPANDIWAYGSRERIKGGFLKGYSGPPSYDGQASHLYRNLGQGHFTNASEQAGIYAPVSAIAGPNAKKSKDPFDPSDPVNTEAVQRLRALPRKQQGKGLGVAIMDFNNDGWPDIMETNDTVCNYLFENRKDGTFKEVGKALGVAFSSIGHSRAGMGVDAGDLDHSGREGIVIGNFAYEFMGLYQNEGGIFSDVALATGVGPPSRDFLTFGCVFLDVDNDGWLDLISANGHVLDTVESMQRNQTFAQRPLFFLNRRKKPLKFDEVGRAGGPGLNKPVVGRGIAYGDLDLDGDLDVIITANGGVPIVMRNDPTSAARRNTVLRLTLEGTKSNRSAIGAKVEAVVKIAGVREKMTVRRTVKSGSSFESQSELPLTLGLGMASQVESLTIHWPSGQKTQLKSIAANQNLIVREGLGIARQQEMRR